MYQHMQIVVYGPVMPEHADGSMLGELLRAVAADVEQGEPGGQVAVLSLDGGQTTYEWRHRRCELREPPQAVYASAAARQLPAGLYFALFHGRDRIDQAMDDWGYDGPMLPILAYHVTYNTTVRVRLPTLDEAAHFAEQCGIAASEVDEWVDVAMVDGLVQYGGKYYGDWTVFLHRPDDAPGTAN
ncbi:hypothetical protein [Rugamonas aquatica]|uniref:Uncharacterized protein n=1 Tax=Rugamonas aquatica TaxID=2743357 RepID=A0A6A7N6E2_9BURK|nr:hypothetical protein [Rugamonas aquatica]MQA40606.1 hypothetical protein [Rugamonas aquatica]